MNLRLLVASALTIGGCSGGDNMTAGSSSSATLDTSGTSPTSTTGMASEAGASEPTTGPASGTTAISTSDGSTGPVTDGTGTANTTAADTGSSSTGGPCGYCSEVLAGTNPTPCPGESTDLYEEVSVCICMGACADVCLASICAGEVVSDECNGCIQDVTVGCGNEFNACLNDV